MAKAKQRELAAGKGREICHPRGSAAGVRVGALQLFGPQLDTVFSNLLCVCPALSKAQNWRPPEVPFHPYQCVLMPPDPFLASVCRSLQPGRHCLCPDVSQPAVVTLQRCTQVFARLMA